MDSLLVNLSFILAYGLSYGLVLFAISIGMVITMGLMKVTNLAHGAFAALGGYLTVALMNDAGMDFIVAVALSTALVALFGVVVERLLISRLYGKPDLDQVLVTLGFNFLVMGALTLIFGPNVYPITLPDYLRGNVDLGIRTFEVYRIFVIAFGILLVLALWIIFDKTNFGAKLRAAVDNRGMASAMGINVNRLYVLAFGLGSALAAVGGSIGAAMLPMEPFYPLKYLILVLVVVALSGFGNIRASIGVAIIVGLVETAGRLLIPQFGSYVIYVLLITLIVWRRDGLFARGQNA
jgi:branched-chain amino acid transport system permease protein